MLAVAVLSLGAALPAADSAHAASRFCNNLKTELRLGAGEVGLLVADLGSGRELCANNAGKRLILASNAKLFTTAALLGRLKPSTRLATTVWRVGPIDRRGTLRGDLYLRGAGDPALAMPAYAKALRPRVATNLLTLRGRVRASGIKRVTGRLYADDSIFDRRRGVPDSNWGTSPYIGPLSGLALNSGFTGPDARTFAADPAYLAAQKLGRSLSGAGLKLRPRVGVQPLPAAGRQRRRIAVVRSPPLSLLAEQTNVHSDNFFAETLLKLLGAKTSGHGTTKAGARFVGRFARSLGSNVVAVDGSGLSRGNRASAREVVKLLGAVSGKPYGKAFRGSLPLTSRDGTVADRMHGTAAERRCEVKTGTLSGVSALSGFCETRSGRQVAFSILMNSVGDSASARYRQDRIAARIAGL